MTENRCLICGGEGYQVSLHIPYCYWRCKHCRSAYLYPQPTPEFLQDFYDKFHLPVEQGGIFGNFEDRMALDLPLKADIVTRQLFPLQTKDSEGLRVLDIGCGKGLFVQQLSSLGIDAEGIDVSATAIKVGREQGVERLRVGAIEQQNDWKQRFDAVTAWATIEHLPNPRSFLESLHHVLKPGGYFFFDTGLAADIVDRWAPGLIQWYDPPQHLFVFSRQGLIKLLRDSGFSTVWYDTNFERTLFRRCGKYLRNRFIGMVGTLLFRLTLGESTFQRMRMESKMPFGSLIFIVARLES